MYQKGLFIIFLTRPLFVFFCGVKAQNLTKCISLGLCWLFLTRRPKACSTLYMAYTPGELPALQLHVWSKQTPILPMPWLTQSLSDLLGFYMSNFSLLFPQTLRPQLHFAVIFKFLQIPYLFLLATLRTVKICLLKLLLSEISSLVFVFLSWLRNHHYLSLYTIFKLAIGEIFYQVLPQYMFFSLSNLISEGKKHFPTYTIMLFGYYQDNQFPHFLGGIPNMILKTNQLLLAISCALCRMLLIITTSCQYCSFHKNVIMCWNDSSVVKSTHCSCRGPKFGSQHLRWAGPLQLYPI